MNVRRAGPEDARGIARVHVRAWRAAYRGIVSDEALDRLSTDERERVWRNLLADEDGCSGTIVVIGDDERVEGFCTVSLPSRDADAGRGTAEVTATYVDPARWRRGAGSALLRAALAELGLRGGFQEVTLWVLGANSGARAFYESFGFEPDGVSKAHEPSGQEVVRMRAGNNADRMRRP